MKRKVLWVVAVLVAMAVGAQFYQPDRTHPPADPSLDVRQHTPVSEEVHQLLRNACYDCHSYETVWPWYGSISPVSWLLAKDIAGGRRHLNFSLWGKYPLQRRERALEDIIKEVSTGAMPLPAYVMMHHEARLDSTARGKIIAWAKEHGGVSEPSEEE